jgi:hypothetical protein
VEAQQRKDEAVVSVLHSTSTANYMPAMLPHAYQPR